LFVAHRLDVVGGVPAILSTAQLLFIGNIMENLSLGDTNNRENTTKRFVQLPTHVLSNLWQFFFSSFQIFSNIDNNNNHLQVFFKKF